MFDMQARKAFIQKVNQVFSDHKNEVLIRYIRDNGAIQNITYQQYDKMVNAFYTKLQNDGVTYGDRIVLIMENNYAESICFLAAVKVGAIPVIIDYSLPKEEKLERIHTADVKHICISNNQFCQLSTKLCDQNRLYIINNDGELERAAHCKEYNFKTPGKMITDAAFILFSSGTTAKSKGVVFAFDALMNPMIDIKQFCGNEDVKYLILFPLFHLSGIVTFTTILLGGGEFGMVENFSPVKIRSALLTYRPTLFGMVPKVYDTIKDQIIEQINQKKAIVSFIVLKLIAFCGFLRKHCQVNLGKYLFKSINTQVFGGRLIIAALGGGISKRETSEFFLNLGYEWVNIYASTEANVISNTRFEDRYPAGAVGRYNHFPDREIKIHHPNANGVGEIYVKSKIMMQGYFRDSKATEAAYDGSYFKTGDMGYIDTKGYLYVVGRTKESIHLSNGEKLSPEEVETVYSGGGYSILRRYFRAAAYRLKKMNMTEYACS